MNEIYKTEGIIIGKRNFFEADQILTIFTRDYGKIQVKAKGLKRSLAKMAGHLEIFNYSKIDLVKGKNFFIVTGAETIDSFSDLREDFTKVSILYYFSEILVKILEEDIRHKNTFNFFLSILENLRAGDIDEEILMIYFELGILSHLGFKPDLLSCVGCRDEISGHKFYFSQEKGGILCETCGGSDFFSSDLSFNAVKLIRIIISKDLDFIKKIRLEKSLIGEVKNISRFFLEHILGRELKSKKFLDSLNI